MACPATTMPFSPKSDKMSRPASPSCVVSLADANYLHATLTLSALDDILGDFQIRSAESSTHPIPTLTEGGRRKRQRKDREDTEQRVTAFLSSPDACWNDLVRVGHRASDEDVMRSATLLGLDSCSFFYPAATRVSNSREDGL